MDAHHAAEPTATKRSASPASSSSALQPPPTASAISTSSAASAPPTTTTKVEKPKPSVSGSMNHNTVSAPSPVPGVSHSKKPDSKGNGPSTSTTSHPNDHGNDDDHTADNNSEAETIVLAGKDGSPIKSRKVIKKEDSDGDARSRTPDVPPKRKPTNTSSAANANTKQESSSGPLREGSHGINAASAGATKPSVDPAKRKRLVDHPQSSKTDSDSVHAKSAKSTSSSRPAKDVKDSRDSRDHEGRDRERERERDKDKDKDGSKVKTGDRVVSHKRKVPRNESDDEADPEAYKARRQRTSTSIDASSSRQRQKDRDHPKITAIKTTHDPASVRHRSTSPHPRNHRRSASTQVASHSSGLSHKKKRIPPPLSTDYQSDGSSGSGSPHFRSSTARGLATPATAESMLSSAKNPAHKKHTDAHGQTQLAKACSKGELENVKKRLQDRPDDLDYYDNAGNTPLQCAALNGHDKVVDFLIKQNCNIDCMNHEKDTPLLDAVENGHLEVVKILLDAGVNPRKTNRCGQEPLELVADDHEDAEEIRKALIKAKEKAADLRRASTEDPQNDADAQSPHSADSPHRRSPSYPGLSGSRRAASSRSHKMSNKVLYMSLNVEALREAAGRGDNESVERILAVMPACDDALSMIAAAKGGHDGVMNLLLAMSKCEPDPPMVRNTKDEEHSTPILAAIGQENVEVIKLLLVQASFDPTKRFKGETYYEIARRRAGPNWKEEETILKNAYDEYRKTHRDAIKKSPSNRRDEPKRAGRAEGQDESAKSSKRKAISPTRDSQRASSKVKVGDKETKRTDPQGPKSGEPTSPKRKQKKDASMPTIAISDPEASPRAPKSPKSKRSDPDAAGMSSDGEAKPRRRKKLITRKEMIESAGRRGSVVSTSSSLREPSSPGDTRHDEVPTEKYHDRAKSIKEDESRDKSRDKLSASDHSAKRSRTSSTPDHGASEKEGEPVKKRRLDMDKKDRVAKASASPDRNRKLASSRDALGSSKHDDKPARKQGDQSDKRAPSKSRKPDSTSEQTRREGGSKSASTDKSIHVNLKGEDSDAATTRDAESTHGDDAKLRAKDEEKKRRTELEAKRKQKEREAEERKSQDEEQRRQAEIKRQEEMEKEKKRAMDDARKKQEDDARKKREAEEAQRQAKEELERRQAEEARILRELEEQKEKEEEERARREKEAAEEARRKREEEQRKEQQERRAREEMRQREIRERRERERLDRLPASIRWLERNTDAARTPEIATRWRMLRGVRFDSIRPQSAGTSEGREQWVLNTQVAMLLGESDVQLTRFSNWDRVPASPPAKHLVMGLARPKPGLTARDDWDLGRQLPDYYLGKEPHQLTSQEKRHLEEESKAKFLALDLFFVKLSDLMSVMPSIPHLRSLEIVVTYHEVAETLEQHDNGDYPSRWKDDPDAARYMGYCPRSKYFVNGKLVREGQVDVSSASYTPWPENRVPRYGLMAVPPTDPNYARLAKEQGLEHLLSGLRTPPMTIAAQTSPSRLFSQRTFGDLSPPQSESTANGDPHHQPRSSTSSAAEQDRPLVNGHAAPFPLVNGTGPNT